VLVPFPSCDVLSVAFVTNEFELADEAGPQRMVAVFMPTTPDPTTEFYMLLAVDKVRETGLTVEDAVRMVISGGLAGPHPSQFGQPPAIPAGSTS
jgi:uncharacterized membrane protein